MNAISSLIKCDAPAIREDDSGALRVGDSRVLVHLVIRAHQEGAPPEEIADRYPTAALADIYGVIGYYLRHRAEMDAWLRDLDTRAEELRRKVENENSRDPKYVELRARLEEARAARRGG